jgi:hypothetical protein
LRVPQNILHNMQLCGVPKLPRPQSPTRCRIAARSVRRAKHGALSAAAVKGGEAESGDGEQTKGWRFRHCRYRCYRNIVKEPSALSGESSGKCDYVLAAVAETVKSSNV